MTSSAANSYGNIGSDLAISGKKIILIENLLVGEVRIARLATAASPFDRYRN